MKKYSSLISILVITLITIAGIILLDRYIENFRFYYPYALFLFIFLPFVILYRNNFFNKRKSKVKYSSVQHIKKMKPSLKIILRPMLFYLRLIFLAAIIIAIARPQAGRSEKIIETQGVDIILVVDVSTSMQAEDFKPNRLGAVKNVVRSFLKNRVSDRIGLSIFAGQSFTQCPLTLDYGVLNTLLDNIDFAESDWDGTAIGNGLANGINRIKDSDAKTKIIILLTDGKNNRGEIDPLLAAEMAKTFNIKVYTIGAGTRGVARIPFNTNYGLQYRQIRVDIDEDLLKEIAETTGGQYFRATNQQELINVYEEIDKLEKTKIDVKEFTRYSELFPMFLWIALLAFAIELILDNTWLRKLP